MNPRITKVTIEVGSDDGDIRQFVLGYETQEINTMAGDRRNIHRHVWLSVPMPLTTFDVNLMQQILDIAQRYPFRPVSPFTLENEAQAQGRSIRR